MDAPSNLARLGEGVLLLVVGQCREVKDVVAACVALHGSMDAGRWPWTPRADVGIPTLAMQKKDVHIDERHVGD